MKTRFLQTPKLAILTEVVKGKFCRFRKGETVKVLATTGSTVMIERVKWEGELPILNQCYGVPRNTMAFLEPMLRQAMKLRPSTAKPGRPSYL